MAAFDSNAAAKGGITWSENGKGWKMTGGQRYIQQRRNDGTYEDVSDGLTNLSWSYQGVWEALDYFITYANPVDIEIKIESVTIRCISCNSGGNQFWGAGSQLQPPATGKGAYYQCILQVYDTMTSYPYTPSKVYTSDSIRIEQMTVNNCISPGSPPGTASFAWLDGYSIKQFTFPGQEILVPVGGVVIVRLHIHSFFGTGNGFIQFDMQAEDSPKFEVIENEVVEPYIWKYSVPPGESTQRWHLIMPAYIRKNGSWVPLEDVVK